VRKVIYAMNVSLDGFVEGPNRELDGFTPDEELHRFWNDQMRETSASLYGRRLYELMAEYWPTADEDPSAPDYVVEFARIWKDKPKVVFSTTLQKVDWNSRLVRDNIAEEVTKLKSQPGKDMEVGGPSLASTFMRLDLIDEYRPVIHPFVLGRGTPFFPALDNAISLRLVETRTFGSGVVYLRYQREPAQ
jgi:dihydrofolate reductase